MNNTTSQQSLYDLYKDSGQSWDLIFNVGIRWICATLGAISNFSLVYVTLRSKNLRTACNILIALDSLFAGIYELSVTNTFIVVLSGLNFIPLRACLPLQVLPLLGFFLSQGAMLFIGLDRLLCMLVPVWVQKHQREHKRLGVPLMIVGMAMYAGWAVALCVDNSLRMGEMMVQCGTGDCFNGPLGDLLNRNQLILMCLTLACYPIILLSVLHQQRNGTGNGATISYTRNMFKSLVAIVVVLFVGQTLSSITRMFGLNPSSATSGIAFVLANGQVCVKYLVYGCNAPLLYAFSSEYRKAFRTVFLGQGGLTTLINVQSGNQLVGTNTNTLKLGPDSNFNQGFVRY